MADPTLQTAPRAKRVQLSLTTPADWIHLDMSDNAMASARKLVDQLAEGSPQADPKLKLRMAGALQSTVRRSKEQGGVLAAFWSRMLDDKTVGASVIAAMTPVSDRVKRNEDGSIDLEAAFRAVTAQTEAGDGTVLDVTHMELPAGPAIRVRKRQEADALGSQHQTEVLQYFVLVPDQPRMVVLTFSTPTLELADALMELFNAMAASLRWRW